jgi:hypothetical protein
MLRRPEPREIALVVVCAAILAWQLFLPGFIGLADNRDFAKVAGRLCIGRPDGPTAYYAYFHPDFERARRYCWESGVPTSELALARAASWMEQRAGDPERFDLRWLGAIHALGFLGGWCLLLVALRPLKGAVWPRAAWWVAAAAGLWIFTDVGFVSYLNSFYSDAAAIVGAMIMVPAALCLLSPDAPRRWLAVCFGLGALLFLTSKGQHAAMAPVVAAVLLIAAWQTPSKTPADRGTRALAVGLTVILIGGTCWVFVETPYWYKAENRFTLVFYKLLPASGTPSRDVEELGLSQSDLPYIGQHAFLPYSPAFDPAWLLAFSQRGSYGNVAAFWLRHPWRAIAILHQDLQREAWKRRPMEFSNYQPEAGRPAAAQTAAFGSWSALDTWLSRIWPMHTAIWYGLVLVCGPLLALRSQSGSGRAVAWTLIFAAVLGLGEFSIASLTDARETDRHLLLFHLFTDFTIFLALVYALSDLSSLNREHAGVAIDRFARDHHGDR